jgi:hypothetical protein
MNQYTSLVKNGFTRADVEPGGKYEPKPGYAFSGAIPMGPVVSLVYQAADEVARVKAIIEELDRPKEEQE